MYNVNFIKNPLNSRHCINGGLISRPYLFPCVGEMHSISPSEVASPREARIRKASDEFGSQGGLLTQAIFRGVEINRKRIGMSAGMPRKRSNIADHETGPRPKVS